ncbi:NuA4 histone H4 acetyltransferase complex and the SWR1 complex subunit [Dimargaris xerosporica]|nr:NuA4 histone H4 acetyltransferase complex and the SWR1 complex subunit [Dimargaris xerosporica]
MGNPTLIDPTKPPTNQPVAAYHYDEIVFNEPVEHFAQILLENRSSELPAKSTLANPYSLQAEQDELARLEKVNQQVEQTIEEYRERMATATKQHSQLKQEIAALEAARK